MNWTTETDNDRESLVCGDYRITACKNGRHQLREGKLLRGTFTDAGAAKAHATFLAEQLLPRVTKASGTENTEAIPAQQAPAARRRTQILGYSACSVLKALGRAGVKCPEAVAILKRHGIEMTKASISVQLGFGRNEHTWVRHGKPAPLSQDAIQDLRHGLEA